MDNKEIKISVVIPVYNGEKWLAQTLENIFAQTYKNLEVIVVNDGSTDGSAEIAARYPVRIVSQKNQGLSVARNSGIEAATGDYIHFMDSDDLINIDYYARMAEAIALTGADIACGGVVNGPRTWLGRIFYDTLLLTTLDDKMLVTGARQINYVWRYIIRRALVVEKKLSFEPGRAIGEDTPFTFEAFDAADKIVTVPGAVYYYMTREGSIVNSRGKEHVRKLKEHWQLTKKFREEFLRKHGLKGAVIPVERSEYRFLKIPVFRKIIYNNGRTRWYLFGLWVAERKTLKL